MIINNFKQLDVYLDKNLSRINYIDSLKNIFMNERIKTLELNKKCMPCGCKLFYMCISTK